GSETAPPSHAAVVVTIVLVVTIVVTTCSCTVAVLVTTCSLEVFDTAGRRLLLAIRQRVTRSAVNDEIAMREVRWDGVGTDRNHKVKTIAQGGVMTDEHLSFRLGGRDLLGGGGFDDFG